MHRPTTLWMSQCQRATYTKSPSKSVSNYATKAKTTETFDLPSRPMSNKLCISQPPHQSLEYVCCPVQPKSLFHTRITKPKSRYTRRHNMESLLCTVRMTWQRVWIRQPIDDALDLDERRGPCVAEKQWNGVGVFRSLVYEVYA